MPIDYNRQHPQLPSHIRLYEAALGYIADGGTYTPAEMRDTIAKVYEIAPEHLALRLDNGVLAFHNYVAHVLRRFTIYEYHIRAGYGENASYAITEAGEASGKRSLTTEAQLF